MGFQLFHDAYGEAYGAKVDRIAAERAWKRLSDEDRRAAIAGIGRYRDYCLGKGIAMKYPSGYLSLHRWEIEAAGDGGTFEHHRQTGSGVSQGTTGTKTEQSPTPHADTSSDMEIW